MENKFTPELIASHIQKYLDQNISLEDIHKGAIEKGVTEDVWNASILLIQSKKNKTESKQLENKKSSKKRKFKSFALMILIFFAGFIIGTYPLYLTQKSLFLSEINGFSAMYVSHARVFFESKLLTEMYDAEKNGKPLSEKTITEKKKEVINKSKKISNSIREDNQKLLEKFSYIGVVKLSISKYSYLPEHFRMYKYWKDRDRRAIDFNGDAALNFSSDFYKDFTDDEGRLIEEY